MSVNKDDVIEYMKDLLIEANAQTELANEHISKLEKRLDVTDSALEKIYLGSLNIFDRTLEGVHENIKSASQDKDCYMYLGSAMFIKDFLIGYTALHSKLYSEVFGIEPKFVNEALKITKKISMIAQVIDSKLALLRKQEIENDPNLIKK